jgi:hypothetical protein
MVPWLLAAAVISKAAVLVTGLVILYYSALAAHNSRDSGLWTLTFGIFLSGIGLLFGGLLSPILGVGVMEEIVLTSVVAAFGLGLVIYSIFSEIRDDVEA